MTDLALSKFITCTIGSIGSFGSYVLADTQQAVPPEWVEGGALVMLLAFLTTATVTLWKSNQNLHKEQRERSEKVISEQQDREARANRTNQDLLEAIRNLKGE